MCGASILCPSCPNLVFASKHEARLHRALSHSYTYKCNFCPGLFKTQSAIVSHAILAHLSKDVVTGDGGLPKIKKRITVLLAKGTMTDIQEDSDVPKIQKHTKGTMTDIQDDDELDVPKIKKHLTKGAMTDIQDDDESDDPKIKKHLTEGTVTDIQGEEEDELDDPKIKKHLTQSAMTDIEDDNDDSDYDPKMETRKKKGTTGLPSDKLFLFSRDDCLPDHDACRGIMDWRGKHVVRPSTKSPNQVSIDTRRESRVE